MGASRVLVWFTFCLKESLSIVALELVEVDACGICRQDRNRT